MRCVVYMILIDNLFYTENFHIIGVLGRKYYCIYLTNAARLGKFINTAQMAYPQNNVYLHNKVGNKNNLSE